MKLYRAVGAAEAADIRAIGRLRPGPPSFQGKWFAESVEQAAIWGHRLAKLDSRFEPVREVVTVEIADERFGELFHIPFLDRIGPARFADPEQLDMIQILGFVPVPEDTA